jgi:hypothetical protein
MANDNSNAFGAAIARCVRKQRKEAPNSGVLIPLRKRQCARGNCPLPPLAPPYMFIGGDNHSTKRYVPTSVNAVANTMPIE